MDGACIAATSAIVLSCALFHHLLDSIGGLFSSLVIAVKGSVAVSSVPGGGAAMGTMAIPAFGSPSIAYINGGGIHSSAKFQRRRRPPAASEESYRQVHSGVG